MYKRLLTDFQARLLGLFAIFRLSPRRASEISSKIPQNLSYLQIPLTVSKWMFFLLMSSSALFCEEDDIAKVSEAMGHLIGKNLQSLGFPFDANAIAKGMKEAAEGKASPLNEEECMQVIAALQDEHRAKLAEQNLQEANDFLLKNKEKKGILSLENGKLQYEIVKRGDGQAVQSYNAPLIRYKGHYLNGDKISSSEELLSLDEAIPGFAKGIAGMKEGEVRTLYIHPDLGYGKQELLHPNALLVFEVEVIKADASSEANAASNSENLPLQPNDDAKVR